jgi:hypothetical protein
MGGVITSILTDAGQRDASPVETALISATEVAAPWGDKL